MEGVRCVCCKRLRSQPFVSILDVKNHYYDGFSVCQECISILRKDFGVQYDSMTDMYLYNGDMLKLFEDCYEQNFKVIERYETINDVQIIFQVDGLFGKYSLEFPIDKFKETLITEVSKRHRNGVKNITREDTLLIMIGENGIGKSTILKILHNLSTYNLKELLKLGFKTATIYEKRNNNSYNIISISYESFLPNINKFKGDTRELIGMLTGDEYMDLIRRVIKEDPYADIILTKKIFEYNVKSHFNEIFENNVITQIKQDIIERVNVSISNAYYDLKSGKLNEWDYYLYLDNTLKRNFQSTLSSEFIIQPLLKTNLYEKYTHILNNNVTEEVDEYDNDYPIYDDYVYSSQSNFLDILEMSPDFDFNKKLIESSRKIVISQDLLNSQLIDINSLISNYYFNDHTINIIRKFYEEPAFTLFELLNIDNDKSDYTWSNHDQDTYYKEHYEYFLKHKKQMENLNDKTTESLYQDIYETDLELFEYGIIPIINNEFINKQYTILKYLNRSEIYNYKEIIYILNQIKISYVKIMDEIYSSDNQTVKFQKILNELFINRKVTIYPKSLIIRTNDDHIIPLSELSSGETNIIFILCLTLLANVPNLIIDEPEVSMSIAWQKKLVKYIKENSSTNLIIATHSPFIVDDNTFENLYHFEDLLIELHE